MNLKNRKLFTWAGIVSLALLFGACYPGGPTFVEDLDIAGTQFDQNFNFGAAQTYALPDSVVLITDPEGENEEPPTVSDEDILNRIELRMNERGYLRVDPDLVDPDIFVIAERMSTTNINIWQPGYWWGWWGWWGGWPGWGVGWGPGWGWGGPPVVSSYTTGSLFIEIIDPNQASTVEEIVPVVWFAAVNGLAQGPPANLTARALSGIDQAFLQSPYLVAN